MLEETGEKRNRSSLRVNVVLSHTRINTIPLHTCVKDVQENVNVGIEKQSKLVGVPIFIEFTPT